MPRFSAVKKIHPLIHRIFLFFKPAYWRKRTAVQKRFDTQLQYIFIGCLIGVIVAAVAVSSVRGYMMKKYERVGEEITEVVEECPPVVEEPEPKEEVLPEETESEAAEPTESTEPTEPPLTLQKITLRKNEALSTMLKRAKLKLAEALQIANALDLVTPIRKLRPGQEFELYFTEENEFYRLVYESRQGEIMSVTKDKDGDYIPQSRDGKVVRDLVRKEGVILTSFADAAKEAEIPANIVQQAKRALEDEVDFNAIQPNTAFEVIFERKITETGREIGKKNLLYITLITHKEIIQRYYFVDAAGNQGFYNEYGESSPKVIMKRPLGSVRISSRFGMRRHPILKYQIHHAGVDFAAMRGTPVPAAADGVIVRLGRNGAYGKYIKIKHNSTYSTAYAHLHTYTTGLRVGSSVKKGEIIGTVGSTGRATGSHLHYEVIKNGKQVNPLSHHVLPKRTLKNKSLETFIKHAQEINPDFQFLLPTTP